MTSDRPGDPATTDDLLRLDAEAVADDDLDEADADAVTEATRRRMRRVASQVYSVRIPVDRLEDLRRLAAARNEAPTVLMRRWVLERLDAETLGTDRVPATPADRAPASLEARVDSLQRDVAALTAAVEAFSQAARPRDDRSDGRQPSPDADRSPRWVPCPDTVSTWLAEVSRHGEPRPHCVVFFDADPLRDPYVPDDAEERSATR